MKNSLFSAIIMALCLIPTIAQAYQFSAANEDGKFIYYYVASEEDKTCIIMYKDPQELNQNDAYNCEEINIPEYANGYKVIGISSNAFHGCKAKKVTIPNTVTFIDSWAFGASYNLETITIGNSLETIGEFAFDYCSNLKEITLPNSLTEIGIMAFADCESLESASLGNSVESIGGQAFTRCGKLKSINIPDKIKRIEKETFCGCWMESVIIPNSVTSIGEDAFSYNSNLAKVSIPNSVTEIHDTSFRGCDNITSLEIDMETVRAPWFNDKLKLQRLILGDNVETIGEYAFGGCSSLKSVTMPQSLKSIGEYAFGGCTGLKNIYFGNSITTIANSSFIFCGLESLNIPETVTTIEDNAFGGCQNLTSVTIPKSVTSIGTNAFYECPKLTSVTSYITDVFETGEYAFMEHEKDTLYVPYGLSETYRTKAAWNVFKNIVEMNPISIPMQIACNTKGSVSINGMPSITGKISSSEIKEGSDNTFTFIPKTDCKLEQVVLNGLDITANVENNTLTATLPDNSQMIVTFAAESGDMNNDGQIDITDVVAIVNKILGI